MTHIDGQVLIVEDQALWREQFFGEPLQELGLKVFPASTKEEALALVDKYQFDLAIIDVNLTAVTGNIDGLIVADHLESSKAKTPIIIVSGSTEALQALHERRYEVFAEIQKASFNLEDFISQVKTAMGQN